MIPLFLVCAATTLPLLLSSSPKWLRLAVAVLGVAVSIGWMADTIFNRSWGQPDLSDTATKIKPLPKHIRSADTAQKIDNLFL